MQVSATARRITTGMHCLLGCAFIATLGGCLPTPAKKAQFAAHTSQYRRLAVACAAAPGAQPGYCPQILEQVSTRSPSRLDFLERVDVLADAKVDVTATPPRVALPRDAAYDAVVALVYSHPGPVNLDMSMIDVATQTEVWHKQLSTKDKNVAERLTKHGYWTPTMIKAEFYGK